MVSMRVFAGACLTAFLVISVQPAAADTYQVILKGKVIMKDGSPPPKTVGIQRICSDEFGDAPGPITNKKGEWTWRMDFDNLLTRTCFLRAELAGFVSTQIDISDINGFIDSKKELPPLVLSLGGADPRTIMEKDEDVPAAARPAWKAMVKVLHMNNLPEANAQMKLVVAAAPKFARGWHTLGLTYEAQGKMTEARDAYQHAVDLDPKLTISWVTLSRCDVLAKDWNGTLKAVDNVIRQDVKHLYPEVYLHEADAQYELKQYDAAEASAKESIKQDPRTLKFRGEYALGVILGAKGDANGAKEHLTKYLQENPNPPDLESIKAYIALVGTPDAANMHPIIEY